MRTISSAVYGLAIVWTAVIPATAGVQATFYASPTGSGSVCSQAQPGSLMSVRDKVRTVNTSMTGDIVVNLRGGMYPLSSTFTLGSSDGGTNGHSVIYQAYPGETPILSGGRQISGWTVADAAKDIYKASVTTGWQFRQLYVNGVRCVRARQPDMTDAKSGGPYYTPVQSATYPFVVNVSETGSWQNLNQVEMVWLAIWAQKRGRIAGFDVSGSQATVRFRTPEAGDPLGYVNSFNQDPGRYFFENAYEFLTAQGEWYLNTDTNTLYYKPRVGEDLTTATVTAPVLETLVAFDGAAGIEMSGVTLEYSTWTLPNTEGFLAAQAALMLLVTGNNFVPVPGAVTISGSNSVVVKNCTIRHTGGHGLVTIQSHDNRITGNLLTDLSAGGIVLGGNGWMESTEMVNDNIVSGFGRDYYNGVGILASQLVNTTITHNEIHDGGYSGISFGWAWDDVDNGNNNNDVSFNRIYRVLQALDDGAAIYSLGRMNNTAIHDNYISDLTRSPYASGCPLAGVYLDAGCCYKMIRNNVLDNCNDAFYAFNAPNHDNTFQGNYYNCNLGKIAAGNTVQSNTVVTGSSWPASARAIMAAAGPVLPVTGLKPPAPQQGMTGEIGPAHTPRDAEVFDAQGRLVMRGDAGRLTGTRGALLHELVSGMHLVRLPTKAATSVRRIGLR